MSHKSKVLGVFVEWRRRMELQTGRKIKILKSDNGKSTRVIRFCSYVMMKALSDTSQLEKLRNRMGWQKNLTVPCWRRYDAYCQIED